MDYFHRIIKKSQRLRDFRRSRQSGLVIEIKGQALVEYLLMVVVMVIFVVGLALAFFAPLGDFLARLNNTYIRCLLETGELPKVGTDTAAVCDAEIPKFEGKNLDGSVRNDNNKIDNRSENARGESSADGSGAVEDSLGGSSSPRGRQSAMLRNSFRSKPSARAEGGGSKTTNIPIDEFNGGEGFVNPNGAGRFGGNGQKKTKKVDISGLTEFDRKKIEREKEKNRAIAVDSESITQTRSKKLIIKPQPEKKPQDDLNVQTDFSAYFKIFFFIVIILFIIILMGGQAMQMTNSSDN